MIRRRRTVALVLAAVLIVFGGCAKRPSVSVASAPAPAARSAGAAGRTPSRSASVARARPRIFSWPRVWRRDALRSFRTAKSDHCASTRPRRVGHAIGAPCSSRSRSSGGLPMRSATRILSHPRLGCVRCPARGRHHRARRRSGVRAAAEAEHPRDLRRRYRRLERQRLFPGVGAPSIDRIGREGMIFTDYYAEQRCTAGRLAFERTGDEETRR